MARPRPLPTTGNPFAYVVVLDETIALYRQHWRTFVAVALLWLVPADLIELAPQLRAALAPTSTVVQTQRDTALSSAVSVVGLVASAWMGGATTVLVLGLLQGRRVGVLRASANAVHHAGGLFMGAVAQLVVVTGVLILSGALTLVAAVVGLGGLVPLLLLIVWARLPRRRTPLLKWLIVYLTPFGPVAYFFVSLNLWQPLLMMDDTGAFASLGRSRALVSGHWFGAAVVHLVLVVIMVVLVLAPTLLVGFVFELTGLSEMRLLAQLVPAVIGLFADALRPICPIALTLLALRLRNVHEGADLLARLDLSTSIEPVEPVRVEQAHR